MKVAPFGSLERFRTEAPIFGSDASEPLEAVKEKPERGTDTRERLIRQWQKQQTLNLRTVGTEK